MPSLCLAVCLWVPFIASVVIAAAAPYSQYILAPTSRTLVPVSVYNVNGSVQNAQALTTNGSGVATFMAASAVTYDFGKNIAGIVSFNVSTVNGSEEYIGISFTESSLWISSDACDATAITNLDEPLWYAVSDDTTYTAEKKHQRGGFRYLNIYHNTSGSVELEHLSIQFTAVPQKADNEMQAYAGYFHCNDDQINRVWYAGAYTNQLCSIDPTAGDALVHLESTNVTTTVTWYNNYTIANGSSVLVDGAKRDRLVWPGDMVISGPSTFVSTNDLDTIKNSIDSLLILQSADGALPYSGVPLNEYVPFSFTYHCYTLIDVYDYYLYTGNLSYLETNWPKFRKGLNYALSFIDSSGMANITTSDDWLRYGMSAHNIEANSILYYTINRGIYLASVVNDTNITWEGYAENVKSAANAALWDASANLFRDNDTLPLTTLHPQDGNSWAIVSNLTTSSAQAVNISNALKARWGKYGAPAPEAGATVSPFASGFELQAHYLAGNPSDAVDLIKLMWYDFMLDDPRMTNSTFIEGYSTNGDLHYAPYTYDARISHAHGWSTGPTSTLTFYAAGLTLTSGAGKTWSVSPNLGGLTDIAAGFETPLGAFAVNVTNTTTSNGYTLELEITTPSNTTGTLSLPIAANLASNGIGETVSYYMNTAGGTRNASISVNITSPNSNNQKRDAFVRATSTTPAAFEREEGIEDQNLADRTPKPGSNPNSDKTARDIVVDVSSPSGTERFVIENLEGGGTITAVVNAVTS